MWNDASILHLKVIPCIARLDQKFCLCDVRTRQTRQRQQQKQHVPE
jgi:hypothetical protein